MTVVRIVYKSKNRRFAIEIIIDDKEPEQEQILESTGDLYGNKSRNVDIKV